jgi:gamma-glutamylcyclotransferase (GGCT)/AIG2-like uncharacterized protein YtfP
MATEKSIQLFVYGLLMPGQALHRQIASYVRSSRPGRIRGALVDVGAYPALVAGNGFVEGVLLVLDGAALTITDRIEGCVPDRPDSLYVRRQVTVDLDDGNPTTAWVYEFGRPEQISGCPALLSGSVHGVPVYAWVGHESP